MPKLVLFDIDGTLVLTGGAGLRAMNRAFREIVGERTGISGEGPVEALNGVPIAGRTDWIILHDTLSRMGRELDPELFDRLRSQYVVYLREEIEHPGSGFNGALPGVQQLLDTLQPRSDVFLGLLTGNFKAGAEIKLQRYDLWRYFRCGAFGDDAADRNVLVPVARDRAVECGLPLIHASDVIVVGDTPNDVNCAHAAGAVSVGVATGGYSAAQLRDCGASVVFDTLEDTAEFVRLL